MRSPAAVLVAVVLHAAQNAPERQSIYRTGIAVVVIDASVTDGRKPVVDLTKDDFEVRDNGVLQSVLDFSVEQRPLDVKVVVDISGSMTRTDRATVERAIVQLSGALDSRDRIGVLMFGSDIAERTPMQHPPLSITLPPPATGLGSAVFDALMISLVTPAVSDRREFVLFMTDGEDTASYFDARTLVETAKHATAPATIVLVTSRASSSAAAALRTVAETTGGEVMELKNKSGLSEAFLAALGHFRSSYTIRYSPMGVAPTGWHELSVVTKAGNHRVRARRGYWAG